MVFTDHNHRWNLVYPDFYLTPVKAFNLKNNCVQYTHLHRNTEALSNFPTVIYTLLLHNGLSYIPRTLKVFL